MLTAHRVRTSLVLAAASASVLAALLATRGTAALPGSSPPGPGVTTVDGIELRAELETGRILAGDHDHHLAISITAPPERARARPPLSVAIVIDRSGSMSGAPMEHARRAAVELVDRLAPTDAFSVVAYSSSARVVVPISLASEPHKAAARAAIAEIFDDGGTCISCGLEQGAAELARSPLADGVRRIVLFSDGQANEGVWDRDELVALAARTAARGASISALGVGLDFDELTMQRIADVGRGHYYFVEDVRELGAMFQRELGGLAATLAADVQLAIGEPAGVRIEEAYGYPLAREHGPVVIPVADLRAGETRKVVVRVRVTAATTGALGVAPVTLTWRRVADGKDRRAGTVVRADVVTDAALVAASVRPTAVQAIEEALAARALEQASVVYETQGSAAAQRVLDQRLEAVRSNAHVGAGTRARIEAAAAEVGDSFRFAAPPKATKLSRSKAHQLAR